MSTLERLPSLRALRATLVLACVLPAGLAIGAGSPAMADGVRQVLEVLAWATLCALAAGLLLAREVEDSIERLAESARALGRGEPARLPRLRLREAEVAACALRGVDALLGWRAAERDRAMRLNAGLQAHVDRLAHAADHDILTGLANRARFHDALQRRLDAAARAEEPVVVFFIDVDDFKAVNDTHGHGVGDELLRAFARRLRGGVREGDLVARLGGDEFAVLLAPASGDRAPSLARELTERLSLPYEVDGRAVRVSASIGVAGRRASESCASELVAAADAAMYVAKHGGKRRFAVSHPPRRKDLACPCRAQATRSSSAPSSTSSTAPWPTPPSA
jgi:diguanylate cyclase (GGDEF)-like protein